MAAMSEDAWLIAIVFAVWAALAAVYAFVPTFAMPGYALVWGVGALLFLGLAALVAWAEGRGRRCRH
jgi:hypothetical protein